MRKVIAMTDYEKCVREQSLRDIERLSILKKLCEEHDITLTEFLLDNIHTELQTLRFLKTIED